MKLSFYLIIVGDDPADWVCVNTAAEAIKWADEFEVRAIMRIEDDVPPRDVTADLARNWYEANWTPADGVYAIPPLFLDELQSDAQEAVNASEDPSGAMSRADAEYDLRASL